MARTIARQPGGPARHEHGQVLVVFALALTVLLTGAGLAFDVGRFYSERRFLQNAADAAALAAANAMVRGESTVDAEAEARDVLARNYLADPSGRAPALPSVTPVYRDGHAGDPFHLLDGILVGTGDVRVAIRNSVDYSLGRVVGLDRTEVGAQSRAMWRGRLLPIAVPRYLNPNGPYAGVLTCPLLLDLSVFVDVFSTRITACLGDLLSSVLRLLPQPGAPWDPADPDGDPTTHGAVVPILGDGAEPPNAADFRGFVALDVRNFASNDSRLYFNGASTATPDATLRDQHAAYIRAKGYPGPDFATVVAPPDPNLQVGTFNAAATAAALDAMNDTFVPGDEVLVTVYEGNVLSSPDFAISAPAFINLPPTGLTLNAGVLNVSRNGAHASPVTLSTLPDELDPNSPLMLGTMLGLNPILYLPNPVTPTTGAGTPVLMNQLLTLGATPGIFNVWVKGVSGGSTKHVPVAVKIGTVTGDFTLTADAQSRTAAAAGDSVTFNVTLRNSPNPATSFGGPVTLSVDSVLANGIGGPARTGVDSITFGSSTVTPTAAGASTTLTIDTGSMAPGTYQLVVRATGMNADTLLLTPTPRRVTHLLPLELVVGPVTPPMEYVDIAGFAVMRLIEVKPAYVSAMAISPVLPDMNDPRLVRGQQARLTPWTP